MTGPDDSAASYDFGNGDSGIDISVAEAQMDCGNRGSSYE